MAMTLLDEMLKMPDCKPAPLYEGDKDLPWIVPQRGMSTEIELIDTLYCLVRLLRPKLIVETGCFLGFTTWALGKAAQTYGAEVFSCDIDQSNVDISRKRCEGLPVFINTMSATKMLTLGIADFVYLDSDGDTRIPCMDVIKPGAIVVIHDTNQELKHHTFQDTQCVKFTETHRGFTILRKC